MPPKKSVVEESPKKIQKKLVEQDNNSETESDVEEVEIERVNSKPTVISKPLVYLTNNIKKFKYKFR